MVFGRPDFHLHRQVGALLERGHRGDVEGAQPLRRAPRGSRVKSVLDIFNDGLVVVKMVVKMVV